MNTQEIISDFLAKNPVPAKEKSRRLSWKDANPEKYEAAKTLKEKGYGVKEICAYFGVSFETIRRQFERDGLVGPRHRIKRYQP